MTGAAYIRVSTEEQTEYSPESQLKKIREYAESRCILLPSEFIFIDEGISGRSAEKRPAFMQMINTAKKKPKPFDVILLWKFSRFARNRQDSILYKTMLRKECGIDVVSITEQLSPDPTAILVEALLEAMDEYYSVNLGQEVRRGMNEKFSRGGVVSSPPFGYRMGNAFFEPDENAAVVRKIFASFLSGKSCRQIASDLNRDGIVTARGCQFQSRSISYILTNPVYTGRLRRRTGQPPASSSPGDMALVKSAHIPIISDEIFEKAQSEIRLQKRIYSGKAPEISARFMLQGLVRCHSCGSVLTRTAKGKALQCHKYSKGQCPVSHYISLDKLNEKALQVFRQSLNVPGAGILFDPDISEGEKNRFLRSFLSCIVFYKNPPKTELFFRTFTVETHG